MTFNEPDHEGSHQKWIEDTHEARRNAMEVRRKIPAQMVRTAPFDVPELVDYYNRLIHEYASQLRPKSDELGEHWDEELTEVKVPPNNETIAAGATDHRGASDIEAAIYDAEWTPRAVNLKTLREKWQTENAVTLTIKTENPWEGDIQRTITKQLYLPVYAADLVLDQLNQCLEFLGWLPKAEVREYRAGEDEVLTHE